MSPLSNARYPGESKDEYRARRAKWNYAVDAYLNRSEPATPKRRKFAGVTVDCKYAVTSKHKKEQPHVVKQMVTLKNGELKTFEVMHPGTLRVVPA